jgi:serine/threonine-protein kinase
MKLPEGSAPRSALDTPDSEDNLSPESVQAFLATEVTDHVNPSAATTRYRMSAPNSPEPSGPKLIQLGDFRLVRKVGEGAMGTVYQGTQVSTGRDVAVKVLFPHLSRNPRLVERFNREARLGGRLDHPNLVTGFAVGEDHGWHYFAMEYVDGRSLQKWLTRLGKLGIGDSLHLILACARALEYIHGHDLVHRDIKPDNVLITRTGVVKLTDLGVAKSLTEDPGLTLTGHSVGTPWYMSPEQARNAKDADGRSDIYALGCVLYYCLAGRPPFSGATLVDLMQAKEAGKFAPVRRFNRNVPKRLDLILDKMLARQVKYRYQECSQLIKDLESLYLAAPHLSFVTSGKSLAEPAPSVDDFGSVLKAANLVAAPAAEEPAREWWYLRYKDLDGKRVTRKLTAREVLSLIEDKDFDLAAKASRHPKEGFRALAYYREFEAVFLSRIAKGEVDRKTSGFRALYKKLDEEDRQRQRERMQVTLRREPGTWTWPALVYWFASRGLLLCLLLLGCRFLFLLGWRFVARLLGF